MNKRKLNHQYKRIKPIKAWPFLVLSLFFLAIGIYSLRQNNYEMIRLRDAVVEADKKGGDVEKALMELREHVHGHMNTNLSSGDFAVKPPIQLKARYDKLASAEAARAKEQNKVIQAKAESTCAAQYPGVGFNSPRVACVAEYMRVNSAQANSVPSELYKFDFVSPRWSPDRAGLSLLASVVLMLLFIIRLVAVWWYKRLL